MSFFAELKRRNVVRVGIAYVIGGWLLLQLTDVLSQLLALPEVVGRIIVLLVAIGLPVALFFAWAFEMTPEGVKREKDVDRSQSITNVTGQKLNNVIIGVLVVALTYFAIDKFLLAPDRAQPESDHLSQQTAGQSTTAEEKKALTPIEAAAEAEAIISRQSIAVLPFDNRSNREEDQFFTDGIHDDLLTTIARIGSMKVISRTSVMEYKNTTKKIPEIAAELGVANILEGGIQRSGDQVRINVQLIDANTDEHLWAEIFDRKLTAENLFAIQSEISQAIASALQATLSPEEAERINSVPTTNLQAYDAYLRGRQLMASRQSAELEKATEEFNRAVALDPEFALAWVGVADSHGLLSIYGTLSQEQTDTIGGDAIRRALAIDENLGEAYTSLGGYYHTSNQPEEAEAAFQKAIELSPNYATVWHWYSNFMLDFPLRSQQALELALKAVELDPRSMIIGSLLGAAYEKQGLYSLAERQYQKMSELNPDSPHPQRQLFRLYLFSTGEFDKAMVANQKAVELDPGNLQNLMLQALIYVQLDDIASAKAAQTRIQDADSQHWTVAWTDVILANAHQNPAAVREAVNWAIPKLGSIPGLAQVAARQTLIWGDKNKAKEIYVSTNPGWMNPDEWQGLIGQYAADACVFSWILVNTGDEAIGRQLLEQTTRYLDVDLAAVNEHVDGLSPEICYLVAGDKNKALDSIETQLAHNHLFHWQLLHKAPMYDLVRDEPRYQAAFQERERIIAAQRAALESGASL